MSKQGKVNQLIKLLELKGIDSAVDSRLHYLAYLCQIGGTNLERDFVFQSYSVFSPTLARDVEKAKNSKVHHSIASRASRSPNKTISDKKEPGFHLIQKLVSEETETLDVLSTICYLHKVGYSADQLPSKINEIKEESEDYFHKAFDLAKRHFSIKVPELVKN